jgi:hypothetical protein
MTTKIELMRLSSGTVVFRFTSSTGKQSDDFFITRAQSEAICSALSTTLGGTLVVGNLTPLYEQLLKDYSR